MGGLIYKLKIDPIEIFTKDELIQVLKRENINYTEEDDSDNYKETLIEVSNETLSSVFLTKFSLSTSLSKLLLHSDQRLMKQSRLQQTIKEWK